jgi:hypothetical protein
VSKIEFFTARASDFDCLTPANSLSYEGTDACHRYFVAAFRGVVVARFERKVVMRWRGKSYAANSSRDPFARETVSLKRGAVVRQVFSQREAPHRRNGAATGVEQPFRHLPPAVIEAVSPKQSQPHAVNTLTTMICAQSLASRHDRPGCRLRRLIESKS